MSGTADDSRLRVLIVDDEATIAETLQIVLRLRGYEATATGDGRRALDLIRDLKPDLVILDLMLPGMDGLSLFRQMRSEPGLEAIPVIVITVVTKESELADGFWRNAIGAEGFVTKPFDPFHLADRVDALLRRHRSRLPAR